MNFSAQYVVTALVAIFSLTVGAEEIAGWNYTEGKMPSIPDKYFASKIKKLPDGHRNLELKLNARPVSAEPHSIQVLFTTKRELEAHAKYRIVFDFCSSAKGEFSLGVRLEGAPWTGVPGSYRNVTATGSWQRMVCEFVTDRNYAGGVCAPMLMLGKFPIGETLELGPVRLEKITTAAQETTATVVPPGGIMHVWRGTANVGLSFMPGCAGTLSTCSSVLTPEREETIKVELCKVDPALPSHSIVLVYNHMGKLNAGTEYEISFPCKASEAGALLMVGALGRKPWSEMQGCKTVFMVASDWRTAKLRFTPRENADGLLHLPRIIMGNFPRPATFFFGPLTLRRAPEKLPLMLNPQWRLFHQVALPADLKSMPPQLAGQTPLVVELKHDTLDINTIFPGGGERRQALLYNEFTSTKDGVMTAGFAADWWMRVYLNGNKVLDTVKYGNMSHGFTPNDHVVELPVHRGKNLLAIEILSGAAGWKLVCGRPTRGTDDSCWVVRENRDWKPVDVPRSVEKGSVLDFSQLGLLDTPAGKYGKVVVRNGAFSFADAPNKTIRFWGCNIGYELCFPSKEQADKLAGILAASGYNAVRLHHFDWALVDKRNVTVPKADIMKRMDYLINALAKRGIYITIDLDTMWTSTALAKGRLDLLWDSATREKWQICVTNLLNHVNEYRGLAWKNDPAISTISPLNEDSPFFFTSNCICPPAMQAAFDNHLKQRGITKPTPLEKKLQFEKFQVENHPRKWREIRNFLLKLGVQAPLTDQNVWSSPAMTLMRDDPAYDYVDNHFYCNHPSSVNGDWKNPWIIGQGSALSSIIGKQADSFFLPGPFAARVWGKPYTITEFNFCNPSQYRGESGVLIGACAALQGWNGLYRFMFSGNPRDLEHGSTSGLTFDVINDPINLLADRQIALLFLRGDVKPSELKFAIVVPEKYLDSAAPYRQQGLGRGGLFPPELSMLAWVGQLGSVKEGHCPSDALELPLNETTPGSDKILDRVGAAKLGEGQLNLVRKYAKSSTGELTIDGKNECLTIGSGKSAAIVSTKAGDFTAGALQVKNRHDFLSLSISSLDGQSLTNSRRMLVLHLTNAMPSEMTFSGEDKTMQLSDGKMPYLARRGIADVSLTLALGSVPAVYGIDLGGRRLGKVESHFENGILRFTADTFNFPTPCFVYEIVR